MDLIDEALRAGRRAAAPANRPTVVVAGGGGALGAEVLEQLLAGRTDVLGRHNPNSPPPSGEVLATRWVE